MDKYDDSRATPKKRTGEEYNNYSDNTKDRNTRNNSTPEIIPPIPPTATPSVPSEMPVRDDKTEI